MSDSEANRESLPSISDLSLNPPSTPGSKTTTADGKPKKDAEKGSFTEGIVFVWHNNKFSLSLKNDRKLILFFFDISVEILLKPTGSAPIINKKKWSLGAEKRVSYILCWLHSYFKLDAEEKIVSVYTLQKIESIWYLIGIYAISVCLCESNICTGSRSNDKKFIRLLWHQWKIDITLF